MVNKTIILVVCYLFFMPLTARANDLSKLIAENQVDIKKLAQEQVKVLAEIEKFDLEIEKLTLEIEEILKEKTILEEEMFNYQEEMGVLEEQIAKRTKKVSQQARELQLKRQSQTFLDGFLEAETISEALNRTFAYNKISQANNETIKSQKEDQEQLFKIQQQAELKMIEVTKATASMRKKEEIITNKKYEQDLLAYEIGAQLTKEESKKEKFLAEKTAMEKKRAEAERFAADTAVFYRLSQDNYYNQGNQTLPTVREGDFQWPLAKIVISSNYGPRHDPTGYSGSYHDGIDLLGRMNDQVYASREGIVVGRGYDSSAGNHVILQHDNGYLTYYLHLNRIQVKIGQEVKAREVVGYMGTTGNSTGVHLHFGISTDVWKNFTDPKPFLGL